MRHQHQQVHLIVMKSIHNAIDRQQNYQQLQVKPIDNKSSSVANGANRCAR
jgi:hypothetical protein